MLLSQKIAAIVRELRAWRKGVAPGVAAKSSAVERVSSVASNRVFIAADTGARE